MFTVKINIKSYLKVLNLLIFILFLVSCKAVGPDYEGAPELEVPENWDNQLNSEFNKTSASQTQ